MRYVALTRDRNHVEYIVVLAKRKQQSELTGRQYGWPSDRLQTEIGKTSLREIRNGSVSS